MAYYEIRGLVISQNGANIHPSVPTSLQDPAINLYTSVVDFIHFHRLMEQILHGHNRRQSVIHATLHCSLAFLKTISYHIWEHIWEKGPIGN